MKIVTWNINGFRAITGQNSSKRYDKVTKENKLFQYIEAEKPDILCLQETKAHPDQIDEDKRYPEPYHGYFNSCSIKKGYSGVVTYTKTEPASVNYELSSAMFDQEGRVVEADFGDFILFNIYFPSGTSGRARVDYKLEFYDFLFNYLEKHKKAGRKLIISGDYNTAHHEIDIARPKENINNSGFLPEERVKLDWMVENGYVDSFRQFNKEGNIYSWWSQRGRARENNVGWRIDYHFVTENLMPNVKAAYIQPDVFGSDHCPVVIELDL